MINRIVYENSESIDDRAHHVPTKAHGRDGRFLLVKALCCPVWCLLSRSCVTMLWFVDIVRPKKLDGFGVIITLA